MVHEIPADLLFVSDPENATPMYAQLAAFLAGAIRSGRIANGERLPSERLYADRLNLSRTTITAAYQELKAMGLVHAYVGRGAIAVSEEFDGDSAGAIAWAQLASRFAPAFPPSGPEGRDDEVDLADGWLHHSLMPHAALAECAAAASRAASSFTTSSILGLEALREALLEGPLRSACPGATIGDVLVTGGAQQGLNVIARALISPGDVVLCESPTWHGAFRAFRSAGADVVGICMDREGIDPDALEDALLRRRPKFVYLIPSYQCPTGRVTSVDRRRRILALCTRFRTPIVESHVYGDTTFGNAPPTLKSMDESDLVIHQGSASKTTTPSLRVGWLVAPSGAMEYLAPAKATLDLSTPAVSQAIFATFLRSGAYARHLPVLRAELVARRDALVTALGSHCPDLRFTVPQGGLYLWAQLPKPMRSQDVAAAAALAGVAIRGGEMFFPEAATSSAIRLCYAAPAFARMDTGVRRLGEALERVRERYAGPVSRSSRFASV